MAHAEHTETTKLLGTEEEDRREPAWHLGVESHLDPSLYLILHLNQQIKQTLRVDDRLSKVGHQANQRRIPFIGYFSESGAATGHQDLSTSVFKFLNCVFLNFYESLGSNLLG